MTTYICTSMFSHDPSNKSKYSAVGGDSSSQSFQDCYWRCIACLFYTSKRFNASARHLLFVNKEPPAFVDGFDYQAFLRDCGVELVVLDNPTLPPKGYTDIWGGVFIMLDILDYFASRASDGDNIYIIDADCVVLRPFEEELDKQLESKGLFLIPIDYSPDKVLSNLSREKYKEVFYELDGRTRDYVPIHYGGEFLGVKGNLVQEVASKMREIFDTSVKRFYENKLYFKTEEPIFSYYLDTINYNGTQNTNFVERIYTFPTRITVKEVHMDLSIWHLPAEKRRGFNNLYQEIISSSKKLDAYYADDQKFRIYLGKFFGIPKRNLKRIVMDYAIQYHLIDYARRQFSGIKKIVQSIKS